MILSELRASAWKYAALLGFALFLAALVGGFYAGNRWSKADLIQAQAKADKLAVDRDAWAQKAADVLLVLNAEREKAQALNAIAVHYEEDKAHAVEDAKSRVLADVRAGRVRVRFPACPQVPAASQAEAAADRREPDAAADSGARIAGTAIGIGAKCDAQVRALQAALIEDRK